MSRKNKRKNKPKARPAGKAAPQSDKPRRRPKAIRQRDTFLAAAAVVLVAFIAYSWWSSSRFEESFLTLASTGQDALDNIEVFTNLGRQHLSRGESYTYEERFPTSGPHDLDPVHAGFYSEIQPSTKLVHSVEHGNIVIYYDEPAPGVLDQLREWASHYDGHWSGIVITPKPNLGETIVLTAWTRLLRLEPFDPAAAAAFIDEYRGRGPENPVR